MGPKSTFNMTKSLLICLLAFVLACQCQSASNNDQCGILLDLRTDANVNVGIVHLTYDGDLIVDVELLDGIDIDVMLDLHIFLATLLDIKLDLDLNIGLLDAYEFNIAEVNDRRMVGRIPLSVPCGVTIRPRISANVLLDAETIVASTGHVLGDLNIDVDALVALNLGCECNRDVAAPNLLGGLVGGLLGEVGGLLGGVTGGLL